MPDDDPYDILGVSRDASREEIKRAYRERALEVHPDHNPDDEASAEAFKRVSWAHEVLTDPAKRGRYDRGGLADVSGTLSDFSIEEGMEAFRRAVEMFGAAVADDGSEGRQPMRGRHLETTIEVSLVELLEENEREIEVPAERICPDCGGDGAAPGAETWRCRTCDGRGQRRDSLMSLMEPCDRCGGTGRVASEVCSTCRGDGRERYRQTIAIRIPAGLRERQTLRRRGEGAPGRFGGEPGDLLIDVVIESPEGFERDGADIRSQIAISGELTSEGGEVDVETLDGEVRMTVPADTDDGDTFRLEGKGLPERSSGRPGDHYVTVRIDDRDGTRLDGDESREEDDRHFADRLRRFVSRMTGG